MKVIYVAGPFTADTPWGIEQNVRRAEDVALLVAQSGARAGVPAMPLCPHANTRYFHGQCTPEFWYEGTLELLRRCDALITVAGWERSKGALAEIAEAERLGLPVFHDGVELRRWLKAGSEPPDTPFSVIYSKAHSLEYPKCPRCGRAVVGAMMTGRGRAVDGQFFYHPADISVYCERADCNYDKKLSDLPTPSRCYHGEDMIGEPEITDDTTVHLTEKGMRATDPKEDTFLKELAALINKHSLENESNTPDFILAMYLQNALTAFAMTTRMREDWYGHRHEPGQSERPVNQAAGDPLRCQERSGAGAQCLHPLGHESDHLFRDDTAAVWEDPQRGVDPSYTVISASPADTEE
jgi:hypothetical protein